MYFNRGSDIMARKIVGALVLLFGAIFIIVGTIFIIISCTTKTANDAFMETAVAEPAIITEIESDEDYHRVMVTYELDGEMVVKKLSEYSSDMYEGQELTIYYDPENPDNITTGMVSGILGTVFLIVGIITAAIGLIPSIIGVIMIAGGKKQVTGDTGVGIE